MATTTMTASFICRAAYRLHFRKQILIVSLIICKPEENENGCKGYDRLDTLRDYYC